jgi:hypothetical protein
MQRTENRVAVDNAMGAANRAIRSRDVGQLRLRRSCSVFECEFGAPPVGV